MNGRMNGWTDEWMNEWLLNESHVLEGRSVWANGLIG